MRYSTAALFATIGLFFLSPVIAMAQDTNLGAENFQQADVNGDGMLAYTEFATFIDLNAADGLGRASTISARGLHARAFTRIDANGDGIVSPQELSAIQ
jgi:Ca2+-binding EF-hand superfamily protein